ncbi:hypothetical protein [Caballeronia grimmiae]|uniref:hypothetical protein n=1 Tax=Caballeronia grimmiae TaxID=1071679 RepID=UPI0038B829BD
MNMLVVETLDGVAVERIYGTWTPMTIFHRRNCFLQAGSPVLSRVLAARFHGLTDEGLAVAPDANRRPLRTSLGLSRNL